MAIWPEERHDLVALDKQKSFQRLVNDRTDQNGVRPNPEASAKLTEASAEASAESLALKWFKSIRFCTQNVQFNS